MNNLQRIEFDMLKHFVSICEKLDLRYYLVCGIALGAVKYKGFIPWDDDIDVALPRDDYEVFIKYANNYLPENIFLQNNHTDPYYPLLGTKLRRSDTTNIETGHRQIDMNHGVFIDIFPLDGYPKGEAMIHELNNEKKRYIRRLAVTLYYKRFSGKNLLGVRTNLMYIASRLFGVYSDVRSNVTRFERIISKHCTWESDVWCNHANSSSEKEYSPNWHYGNGIWGEFEGLRVRIPEHYDNYLTLKYGDWRGDIPKEQQVGHHYCVIRDLTRSYLDYIEKRKKGKIKIKKM